MNTKDIRAMHEVEERIIGDPYLPRGKAITMLQRAHQHRGLLLKRLERAERDDSKELLGEAIETLRTVGLDQTSPPGTRLWKAAVDRIRQLERERDEALARCRELEKLQEAPLI